MLVSKSKRNVCSSKEQSHLIPKSKEYRVDQYVKNENKDETSKWECQANVISIFLSEGFSMNFVVNLKIYIEFNFKATILLFGYIVNLYVNFHSYNFHKNWLPENCVKFKLLFI